MGRKKKPKWDDPEQSTRFIELAEQVQTDDAEERFEEAMKRILSVKREGSDKETKPAKSS
ncbi:MAG: hypothetical protein ACLP5H_30660 [Desulfomonilaceae bacterium]